MLFKNPKVNKFFNILLIGNLAFFFLLIAKSIFKLETLYLFTSQDRFNDFFNNIRYTVGNNPYQFMWANIPPLFLMLCRPFNFIYNLYDDPRYTFEGIIIYLFYSLLILVLIYYVMLLLFSSKTSIRERLTYFLILITSYPFIFALDRGNYVMLITFIIGFIIYFDQKEKYYLVGFFISVGFALKLYPALFGILLLQKRRWKEIIFTLFISALLIIIPLATFKGGLISNFHQFIDKTIYYLKKGNSEGELDLLLNLRYNNSIYMILLFPAEVLRRFISINTTVVYNIAKSIAYLFLVIGILGTLLLKRKHDKYLLISIIILLFTFISTDYNIIIIYIPLIYWLLMEKEDWFLQIVGAILLIFKGYVAIYTYPDFYSVTWQVFINPIILLMIFTYIYVIRFQEIKINITTFFNNILKR